jgi:hypothetical protein
LRGRRGWTIERISRGAGSRRQAEGPAANARAPEARASFFTASAALMLPRIARTRRLPTSGSATTMLVPV